MSDNREFSTARARSLEAALIAVYRDFAAASLIADCDSRELPVAMGQSFGTRSREIRFSVSLDRCGSM